MVRGNHDAESQITRKLDRPPGLHVFDSRKAESFELPEIGVVLHGGSFGTAASAASSYRRCASGLGPRRTRAKCVSRWRSGAFPLAAQSA